MTTSPSRHRLRLAGVAVAATGLLLGAAACSSDDTTASTDTTAAAEATTSTTQAAAGVTARDAWARPSPMVQGAGAAYMELTGGATDDELVAATVSPDIAAAVELHETSMAGSDDTMMDDDMMDDGMMDDGAMDDGMMDADDMGGMMQMRQVSSIPVPAGATVTLEPGGLHLMLIDLAAPLTAGQTFDITLEFASGERLVVPVTVRS